LSHFYVVIAVFFAISSRVLIIFVIFIWTIFRNDEESRINTHDICFDHYNIDGHSAICQSIILLMLKSGYKLESSDNEQTRKRLYPNGEGNLPSKKWVLILFPLLGVVVSWIAVYLGMNGNSWGIALAIGLPVALLSLIRLNWGVMIITALAFCAPGLSNSMIGDYIYILIHSLTALLFFLTLCNWRKYPKSHHWTHILSLLIIVWLGYNMLILLSKGSILSTDTTGIGFKGWVSGKHILFSGLMFWIVLYNMDDLRRIILYSQALIVMGIIASIWGLYQEASGITMLNEKQIYVNPEVYQMYFLDGKFRIYSFMKTPFVFGVVLAGLALLAIVKSMGPWKLYPRIAYGVSALVFLSLIILSGTFTAFAIFPIGLLFFAFLSLRKNVLIWVGTFLVAMILYFTLSEENYFVYRVSSAIHQLDSPTSQQDSHLDTLLSRHIFKHPVGNGLGSVENYTFDIQQGEDIYTFTVKGGYQQMVLEQGWVGFLFFISLTTGIFWVGVRGLFHSRDIRIRNLYISFLVLLYVWIIAQYSGSLLQNYPASIVYFTIAAILINLGNIEHTSLEKKKNQEYKHIYEDWWKEEEQKKIGLQ